MLPFLLLMVVLSCARASCPATCKCSQLADGRDELACPLPSGRVLVQGTMHQSVEITCLDDHLNCSELPPYPFSRNGSLALLVVSDCSLGSLACWLGALGVRSVDTIALKEVKNGLAAEHVRGLVGVRALRMYYSYAQHDIPLNALTELPELTEFRIREGNLTAPKPINNLNLTYLELSSDGIHQLASGAFELANLQKLFIWDNKIENVTEDTFRGLSSLRLLDLSRNRLRVLPARLFSQMTLLTHVHLNINTIEEVHSDAFSGLRELKEIEVFNNRAPMRLSPRCLANLPSLEELRLENCQIPNLPPDLLANSTQLKTVTIAGNAFDNLPDNLFRNQQNLKMLDLGRNKIKSLTVNTFWDLGSLLELNLDGNLIEELPDDVFNGLTKLETLRLNNNRIRVIADSALSHAQSLINIKMSNNQLSFRPSERNITTDYREPAQSPFRWLVNSLKSMDLSGNKISRIFDDWRYVLHIETLNLSGNAFTNLSNGEFDFPFCNHSVIDLRHNQISTVDLTNAYGFGPEQLINEVLNCTILFDDNPFACNCHNRNFFLRLQGKYAYYNALPIFDIGNSRCDGPSNLKGELVKDIDPSILTCALQEHECPETCACEMRPATNRLELTCIDLPYLLPEPQNYSMDATILTLKSIPHRLDLPKHVDTLILKGLNINEVPYIPTTVNQVDLTNNVITDIPVELLRRNMTLHLAGNPFICDCSHEEELQILMDSKDKILDYLKVRCQDSQSPWQIDVPRLCSVRHAAILGGSLATLSVILIVLAGLYYRYSIEIKIFLYSCEKLRWLISEDDVDRDKKYDAFISFSHKDQKFVAEKLIPVLEGGNRPFRLCVHYRDWIVGEWIPAQIVNSVEQSRRTIIVLSKDFVESVWGTMEFRIAHKRAQEEKRTRIVVILLEDAPPAGDLDAELRAYLSTNTYVKWGDPWFWEKLRYALAGGRVGSIGKKVKVEKVPKGGLNARLNSRGQIVNDTKDTLSTELSID